jgi:hypothetical protein
MFNRAGASLIQALKVGTKALEDLLTFIEDHNYRARGKGGWRLRGNRRSAS